MTWLEIDRTVEYKGIEYRVLANLDNDLLLVVLKKDYIKGDFPLQTIIIPDK